MIKFTWLYKDDDKSPCYEIRKRVFVEEQGFIDEFDDIDEACEHLLATDDWIPIGTARLFNQNGTYHAGRVCLDLGYRGSGFGRMIMDEVEKKAKEHGAAVLELGAQLQVKDFYLRCGYRAQGKPFFEQSCPHIIMIKEI